VSVGTQAEKRDVGKKRRYLHLSFKRWREEAKNVSSFFATTVLLAKTTSPILLKEGELSHCVCIFVVVLVLCKISDCPWHAFNAGCRP
jgi:cell division protein FtsW (lipid II flippase)